MRSNRAGGGSKRAAAKANCVLRKPYTKRFGFGTTPRMIAKRSCCPPDSGGQWYQRCGFIFIAVCVSILAHAESAFAHDARPLSVLIAERQAHTYRVEVRMPPSLDADNRPEISWPSGCMVSSHGIREGLEATEDTMLLKCTAGLEGQRIGIHYPLFNPALSTLLRFIPSGDATRTAVLPPDRLEWTVPPSSNWKTVAHDYFLLGVKHIWEGIDHLLFVTGLLILARTPRRIAVAITGFTLAHSVTLSLSALGVVRFLFRRSKPESRCRSSFLPAKSHVPTRRVSYGAFHSWFLRCLACCTDSDLPQR